MSNNIENLEKAVEKVKASKDRQIAILEEAVDKVVDELHFARLAMMMYLELFRP